MLKENCFFYSSILSDSENADDNEGMFSRLFYMIGLQKRSEIREKIDSDKSDTDLVSNTSRTMDHKNSSSLYSKVLFKLGLRLPQSDYEQYELVQSFTDSLGIDTESDSANLSSNDETEIDFRL